MAPKVCGTTPPVNNGRQKKAWTVAEKSTIQAMTQQYHQILAKVGNPIDPDQVRVSQLEEMWAKNAGDMVALASKEYDRIGSWLAAKMGFKNKLFFSPSLNYNQAGEVRQNMLEARRVAQNLVDNVGRLAAVERIEDLNRYLKNVNKQLGLTAEQLSEVVVDTIEIGFIPTQKINYTRTAAVEAFQKARYLNWEQRMLGMGFTSTQIDELKQLAVPIGDAFDEMRLAAKAVGYDIPKLLELGYFPRIKSKDFQRRMKAWNLAEGMDDTVEQIRNGGLTLSSTWDKSRKTHWLIPEDINIFASFAGTTPSEVMNLLNDPKDFLKFIHDNLTTEQVDDLISSGVMGKIPMSSREVFEYMSSQYDLPYAGLNEMFVVDPLRAMQMYEAELKQSVGNHAIIKTMVGDGIKAGWAFKKSDIPVGMERNFVAVGSIDLSKWLGQNVPDEIKAGSNIYIHKVVADQWKSLVATGTSPVQLSNMATAWNFLSRGFNKSVLLGSNVLYLGRLFLGAAISSHASGGNLANLTTAFMDISRLQREGLAAFDNTKPYAKLNGQVLTKRELMEKFMLRRGSNITPGSYGITTGVMPSIGKALDPRTYARQLNYAVSYGRAFNDPWEATKGTLDYLGKLTGDAFNNAFTPLAVGGNYIDMATKWNAVSTLVERVDGWGNALGKGVTSQSRKSFNDIEELLRHVDDYFPMFDEIGSITSAVGKYIRPFGVYAMVNPPMQLRHMLRDPRRYLAWHKLMQASNQDNQDTIPEGGMTAYDLENYPVQLTRPDASGEALVMFTNNYDPITDAFTYFKETGEVVSHIAFGKYTGTSKEQRDQALGKVGWWTLLEEQFKNSYIGNTAQILSGKDPLTGRDLEEMGETTLLGVPVSPKTKAWLQLVPTIGAVDRANPFGMFGETAEYDELGNVVNPGRSSVFGYQRHRNRGRENALEKAGLVGKVAMNVFGVNIRVVDTAKNMGWTYADIETGIRDVKGDVTKLTYDILQRREQLTDKEFQKKSEVLSQLIDVQYQLEYDKLRVQAWLKNNGVEDKDVMNELRKRNLLMKDLPIPGAKDVQRLERERQEIIDKVWTKP